MEIYIIIALVSLTVGFLIGRSIAHKNSGPVDESKLNELKISLGQKDHEIKLRMERIQTLETENAALNKITNEFSKDKAVLEEQKSSLIRQRDDYDANIKKLQEQMKTDFSLLANNIFEEKTDKFKKSSQENLNQILSPFKEQIEQFKKDVGEKYSSEAQERFSLKSKIDDLVNLNKTITEETKNLTTALKGDAKKQGNWGEFKLEKLLEQSGLERGKEYIAQAKGTGLKNEDGNATQPDFIVYLPENKHIIIDSKVSLVSYVHFVEAASDAEKELAKEALFKSLRKHIDDLSDVNYHMHKDLLTPEFTFLFSPFEGALSLVIDTNVPNHGISLMQYAWEKKIAIVTPMTLMATLKTIASLWRFVRQESNAIKIADAAGKIYDKFHGFIDDMESVQKKLEDASKVHGEAFKKLNSGRDNLFSQFEGLKKLGAKAKKSMDAKYLEDTTEEK